ncbi:hypothetical protein [Dactylosporangium sp. CA-233914]|uniref:hypothetical protein n=1 Tax=Dactylosporangium sp. CA-233914 TaxID=3239934 RepID=UPI003D8B670A
METCSACGRPAAGAAVESSHVTSEGIVRYRRCPCGRRWLELAALVLLERATATLAARASDPAREARRP